MHAGHSESEEGKGELHYDLTTCRWVFNAVTIARFDFLKLQGSQGSLDIPGTLPF